MNGEYSKLQTDIINGAIPLDEATQNSLTRIMRIAEAAGDEDVIEMIKPVLAERTAEKYIRSARVRTEYTDREKAILRGDVSYEDATGYEYRAILNVAKRINDIEIVRHMETLLQEKRADYLEHNKQATIDRYYQKLYDSAIDKEKILAPWERKLLHETFDYANNDIAVLKRILRKARMIGNEEDIELAETLVALKENRFKRYVTTDRNEARQIIKANTWFPVPGPGTYARD